MDDQEIRLAIVSGLAQSRAILFRDAEITDQFLAAEADMRIEDMQMDSLSIMELCISIEVDTGASILPEEMVQIESLEQLVGAIKGKLP